MANATADDDDPAASSSSFVTRSTVRSGHKREFDFAFHAHAQLPSSLGRTRRTSRPTTASPPSPPPPPLPSPIPLDVAVTKRPRGDRDNPIAAAAARPLQLNPVKHEPPAPPPYLNQNTPTPTLELKQSKQKFPAPTPGTVKLETPMEQVKLKAPTPASEPSPSKHKSLEPTLQSNVKTPVSTQELKQSNYKPPAPPLELMPVNLKTSSPSPAGVLEPEPVKLKAMAARLGPVKVETPMEQVKLKALTQVFEPSPSPSKHKSLEPTLQSNVKTPVNTQELKQSNYKPPAPPLDLTPVNLKTLSPSPAGVLEPEPVKLKALAAPLGPVKLETPMEQVKLKALTPAFEPSSSPSKHKSLEPTLQSNVKTPVNTQELKQSNYKPPAPPLDLTPVKLKKPSRSPSPAGVLEPEPVKLKAMAAPLGPGKLKTMTPSGALELELEQVKLKSPAARLGPVKLEPPTAAALEREPEQVKPKVAGSVQEVGKSSPWELIPGRQKTPANVEELIATGLLEGVTLKYITGLLEKKDGLKGVVKGTSILCHCASCKGLKVISAHQFEQHAGSSSNNPAAFICFENGKTIRCVLQACKLAPLGMLEVWIKSAISLDTTITCQKCNSLIGEEEELKLVVEHYDL